MVKFGFECFESHSNASNLHLNPFRIVGICIQMLWISFEWFKFGFEWLESLSNDSKLQLNDSNPFWMLRIWIRMVKSRSNASNLHLSPFGMLGICIWMFRISFEWLESLWNSSNLHSNDSNPFKCFKVAFEWLETLLNGSNFHSNASNLIWMVRIWVRMVRIPFEWFEYAFKCF